MVLVKSRLFILPFVELLIDFDFVVQHNYCHLAQTQIYFVFL